MNCSSTEKENWKEKKNQMESNYSAKSGGDAMVTATFTRFNVSTCEKKNTNIYGEIWNKSYAIGYSSMDLPVFRAMDFIFRW